MAIWLQRHGTRGRVGIREAADGGLSIWKTPHRFGVSPAKVGLFLTAGVDVQKDRIEVEIVAWGRNKESWSVDYRVIEGDTARPDVWAKLDTRSPGTGRTPRATRCRSG